MPHETAAVSAQVLCTSYNHAPCHFMQSHIRKVYACLAVTCHLHFWQNDRDLLRATAVTRRWNGYRNKSQHRKSTLEKKILAPLQQNSNPQPFNHESGALTTELSPPPEDRLDNQDSFLRNYMMLCKSSGNAALCLVIIDDHGLSLGGQSSCQTRTRYSFPGSTNGHVRCLNRERAPYRIP